MSTLEAENKITVPIVKGYYVPILKNTFINHDKLRTSFRKLIETRSPGKDFCDSEMVAAEVGVYEGENARIMLVFANKMKLHLVDDYENLVLYTRGPNMESSAKNQIETTAQLNLGPFEDRKIFVHKKSMAAAKDYPDLFFDFVYIDGDHEYEEVKKDIYAWYPKVKYGGILGGHDVNMPDVKYALTEFIVEYGIPNESWGAELNLEPKSDWWIFK